MQAFVFALAIVNDQIIKLCVSCMQLYIIHKGKKQCALGLLQKKLFSHYLSISLIITFLFTNLKPLMRACVQLDSDTSATARKIVFKDIMWHNAASGTHTVRQCQTPPSKVELYFSLQSTLAWTGKCVACPVRLQLISRSGQSTEYSSHVKTVPSSLIQTGVSASVLSTGENSG